MLEKYNTLLTLTLVIHWYEEFTLGCGANYLHKLIHWKSEDVVTTSIKPKIS